MDNMYICKIKVMLATHLLALDALDFHG